MKLKKFETTDDPRESLNLKHHELIELYVSVVINMSNPRVRNLNTMIYHVSFLTEEVGLGYKLDIFGILGKNLYSNIHLADKKNCAKLQKNESENLKNSTSIFGSNQYF